MCGHVGLATLEKNHQWKKRADWMQQALLVDTIRGTDGTGMCCVPHDEKEQPVTYKKALAGWDYLQLERAGQLLLHSDKFKVMMGHNRATTKGASNDINSHPFNYGDIHLAHNGTLKSFNGLDAKFTVDSQAICDAFSREGAANILPKLNGAFALVWYDAKQDTLNFARNDEREFHFAFSKDKRTVLWASEPWMINELVARKAINMQMDEYTYQLNPGKHVAISFNGHTLDKYESTDFEIYKPPVKFFQGGNANRDKTSLETLGYKVDQQLLMKVISFEPYMGKTRGGRGTLIGELVDKFGFRDTIRVYYVDKALAKEKYLMVSAKSAFKSTGGATSISIVGDNPKSISSRKAHKLQRSWGNKKDSGTLVFTGPHGKVNKVEWDVLTKHGCVQCTGNIDDVTSDFVTWTQDGQPYCASCSWKNEKQTKQEK